jgi:hypothetical protein
MKRSRKLSPEESLKSLVGQDVYTVWVNMLRQLVPDGRTHRLAPLIAGMLQYAATIAHERADNGTLEQDSVVQALIDASETDDPEEAQEYLAGLLQQLFRDAHVAYRRSSSRGEEYSIAESAIDEFINWYNMPWESY